MEPDVELKAMLTLDEAGLAALQKSITVAITKGFDSVRGAVSTKLADQATKSFVAAAGKMRSANKETASSFASTERAARSYGSQLNDLDKYLHEVGTNAKALKDSATYMATAVQRSGIAQNEATRKATYERLSMEREAGKLQAIEAQRTAQSQIIAQRQGGEKRLQAARFTYESLGRLEKAFGATVTGIAKTATSAVSSALSGLGHLFHRSNSQLNTGLDSALRERESSFRSSFRRQEMIIGQSITRQEKEMVELRKVASTGLTGAITGRGIGTGLVGLGLGVGAASALKKGYTDAVNYREQVNKNRIVFGQFSDQVINFFAKGAPKAMGQTEAQVLEATGTFGNLFKNLGLGDRDVFNFSTSLTALASDLASFNNTPVDEAMTALRAGLTGESEPLKKFGIDVSDAALKHEAFLLGISDGKTVLTAAQKAQAAYSVITKQAGDAQGDFARTANEGANAARIRQASIEQLASTIAGYFVPVMTKANIVIGEMATSLGSFITGDIGPALQVLRTGLQGAAIGLGALIAVKGGIEVLQLLKVTLGLILTPMGAVIAAAALLGAGINIMMQRSAAFRAGVEALGTRLRELADGAGGRLQPVFERLGSFITGTVVPAVESFAVFLSEHLVGALNTTISFITGTAIPGLQRFASFIAATMAPVIVSAVRAVTGAFEVAWGAVSRFVDRAMPYLQPAIDGFSRLGSAIRTVFGGGGFGDLGAGLGAAAAGIGASAGKIGSLILSVLAPVGTRIFDFLKGVFTKANIMKLAGGFLDLVEEIGRILGSIATDPRLIAALGVIAGVAAVIALKFAKGLVEGIISNIPDLLAGAGKILAVVFAKAIANPEIIAGALAAVFAYATLVRPLIKAFQSAGEQAGTGFAAGLKSKFTAGGQFVSALFGGPGSATTDASGSFFKQQIKQVDVLQASLRSLGSATTVAMNPTSIKAATKEYQNLSNGLTDAQLKGLLMRDALQQGFGKIASGSSTALTGIKGIGGAFADVGRSAAASLSGLGQRITDSLTKFLSAGTKYQSVYAQGGASSGEAFSTNFRQRVSEGFTKLKTGLTEAAKGLVQAAKGGGAMIGQALGSAALLAFGGFMAGKAEGASGGSGVASLIGSSLSGAMLGAQFGPQGAAAGAAVGALSSAIGTAMGKAQRSAELARKKIASFVDILKKDLVDAAGAGASAVLSLDDALKGTSGKDVFATVKEDLSDVAGYLVNAGVNMGDVVKAFRGGEGAVQALVDKVRMGTDATDIQSQAAFRLAAEYSLVAAAVEKANVLAAFDPTSNFTGRGVEDPIGRIQVATEAAAAATREHTSAVEQYVRSRLAANAADKQAAAAATVQAAARQLEELNVQIDATNTKIDRLFTNRDTTGLQATVDAAIVSLQGFFNDPTLLEGGIFNDAQVRTKLDTFSTDLAAAAKAGLADKSITDSDTLFAGLAPLLEAALSGVTDESLRQKIVDTFAAGIQAASAEVEQQAFNIQLAADPQGVFDQLAAGFAEPYTVKVEADTTGAKASIDDLGVGLESSGSSNGGDYTSGLAKGIRGGIESVKAAAREVANAAVTASTFILQVRSPSRVMARIGAYVSEGLADGILSGADAVDSAMGEVASIVTDNPMRGKMVEAGADVGTSIGKSIGQAIVDGIADKATDIAGVAQSAVDDALRNLQFGGNQQAIGRNSAIASLFAGMFGSSSKLQPFAGTGGFGSALAAGNVTDARQSFLSGFDSNASTIFQVNQKKLADLNAQERQQYGGNIFSLTGSDVFGSANLKSITSVFDSIIGFGDELIKQGNPIDEVLAQVKAQTDDFIKLAANLGFNEEQLRALADSLGLSETSLQGFIDQVNSLNSGLSQAPTPKAEDTTTTTTTDTTPAEPTSLNRPIYIYLPTGDPEANALAVANQLAYASRLP